MRDAGVRINRAGLAVFFLYRSFKSYCIVGRGLNSLLSLWRSGSSLKQSSGRDRTPRLQAGGEGSPGSAQGGGGVGGPGNCEEAGMTAGVGSGHPPKQDFVRITH